MANLPFSSPAESYPQPKWSLNRRIIEVKGKRMIKKFEVKGLFKNFINIDWVLNEDLNIITGANGSGKTTVLKLMWYLISGQIDRVLETPLDSVSIETNQFKVSIAEEAEDEYLIKWSFLDEDSAVEIDLVEDTEETENVKEEIEESLYISFSDIRNSNDYSPIRKLEADIRDTMESSLFFPSFRRIESSFSRVSRDRHPMRLRRRQRGPGSTQTRDPLQEVMSNQSTEQSVGDHKFVTAFSTTDVVELLSQKQKDISKDINTIYQGLSHDLEKKIPKDELEELQDANSALQQIREEFKKAVKEEENLQKQLTSLEGLINEFFKYRIEIEDGFTLGKKDDARSADILSYGEQQMLSFLCYNAFSSNTTIFIDEPELSLHIDWQRLLLPTLLDQGTGNQFFIATHSSDIFARYPHKEKLLGDDRGDIGGEI